MDSPEGWDTHVRFIIFLLFFPHIQEEWITSSPSQGDSDSEAASIRTLLQIFLATLVTWLQAEIVSPKNVMNEQPSRNTESFGLCSD